MDGFVNSNASLMASDGSDFGMIGMNGMNMMPANEVDESSFNNVGLVSDDSEDSEQINNYNNAGLISADSLYAEQPVKEKPATSKSVDNKSAIKDKLNNIQQKSDKMLSGNTGTKVPQTNANTPAGNDKAKDLTSAVAKSVDQAEKPKAAVQPAKSVQNKKPTGVSLEAPDVKEIRLNKSIQDLSDAYVSSFKKAFDIDLIPSIVYENMTNLFHVDMGEKPIYYMCNTYRLSSIINLMEYFIPWIYSTFIFGESSAQNLQIYKDVIKQETELHAQSNVLELIGVYKKRYIDRITDELYVDCVMVTPGASTMSDEMMSRLSQIMKDMVNASATKLNGVYKINVAKLSDDAISNAKYVHSNFWYLLQIYEFNIADKRASMTKTAIKAKEALKM